MGCVFSPLDVPKGPPLTPPSDPAVGLLVGSHRTQVVIGGGRCLRQMHRAVGARLVQIELSGEIARPRVARREERRQIEDRLEGGEDGRVLVSVE